MAANDRALQPDASLAITSRAAQEDEESGVDLPGRHKRPARRPPLVPALQFPPPAIVFQILVKSVRLEFY